MDIGFIVGLDYIGKLLKRRDLVSMGLAMKIELLFILDFDRRE